MLVVMYVVLLKVMERQIVQLMRHVLLFGYYCTKYSTDYLYVYEIQ